MARQFNITGNCIPARHYMVDMPRKLDKIMEMIARGDYFTINRPRQYGKTTIMYLLEQHLVKNSDYLALSISFEEIDAATYKKQEWFISTFLEILNDQLEYLEENQLSASIKQNKTITNFKQLNTLLVQMIIASGRRVVLMIDEVDKAGNNQLFLDFLGILRSRYLKRSQGKGEAFHSVILAGVHDVKTLKAKIRPDSERKYNSPWNIAVDFDLDLELFPEEIAPMLEQYVQERNTAIDIPYFTERLFYFTSGYPFLVSYLCKIIDEEILPGKKQKEWQPEDLVKAVQIALKKENTNFDSLIKNLENNPELYELVFKIVMNEKQFSYNRRNPVIGQGTMYGILKEESGKARIHNRLYEQLIYDYMSSKLETSGGIEYSAVSSSYIRQDGTLDIEKVIRKFQEFMNEQYSKKDTPFLERNGRLLFLAFIKPIINGKGFDFKEVEVSEERRLDVVITFESQKYIVELKIWRGDAYHQEGIRQLCDYLDRQNQTGGYLLIYDLNNKSGKRGNWEKIEAQGKKIYTAWL